MGPNVFWIPNIFWGPNFFWEFFFVICEGMKEDSERRLEANLVDLLSLFQVMQQQLFSQKEYLNVFDNKSRENHLLLKMSIVYSAKHIALMNGSVIASEL